MDPVSTSKTEHISVGNNAEPPSEHLPLPQLQGILSTACLISLCQTKQCPSFDDLIKCCSIPTLEESIIIIYNNQTPTNDSSRAFFRKLLYAYITLIKNIPDFSSASFHELQALFASVSLELSPELIYLKSIFLNPLNRELYDYHTTQDVLEYYAEYALYQKNYPELIKDLLVTIYSNSFEPKKGMSPESFNNLRKCAIIDLIVTLVHSDYGRLTTLIPLVDEFFSQTGLKREFWILILRKLMTKAFPDIKKLCEALNGHGHLAYCSYLLSLYEAHALNELDSYSTARLYHLYKMQIKKEPRSEKCALSDLCRTAIYHHDFSSLNWFMHDYYQESNNIDTLFDSLKAILTTKESKPYNQQFMKRLFIYLADKSHKLELSMLERFIKHLLSIHYIHPSMLFLYADHKFWINFFQKKQNESLSMLTIPFSICFAKYTRTQTSTRFNFFSNKEIKDPLIEDTTSLDWRLFYELTKNHIRTEYLFEPDDTFNEFIKEHIKKYSTPDSDFWKKMLFGFSKNEDTNLIELIDLDDFFTLKFNVPITHEAICLSFDLLLQYRTPFIQLFLDNLFNQLAIRVQQEEQLPVSERHLSAWALSLKRNLKENKSQFLKSIKQPESRSMYKALENLFFFRPALEESLKTTQALFDDAKKAVSQQNEERLLKELTERDAVKITLMKKKKPKLKKKKSVAKEEPTVSLTDSIPVMLHQYQEKQTTVQKHRHPAIPPTPIQKHFLYSQDYQSLTILLNQIQQTILPKEHPYKDMGDRLKLGLIEALEPFRTEGAHLADLQNQASQTRYITPIEDVYSLSWFTSLEHLLKKIPHKPEHAILKSILTGQDLKLRLPANIDVLPLKKASAIQLIWKLAIALYQDMPEESMLLLLYGSTSRVWLDKALQIPLSGEPHDLDFSLRGDVVHWKFFDWIKTLDKNPDVIVSSIKNDDEKGYAQICFIYQSEEIDLNFHIKESPILGSFSAQVILPIQSPVPQFFLEPNAILHFQRRKIVIDEPHFYPFLTSSSLHFLFKELCLRVYEGWKLSTTTATFIASDQCQNIFLSPEADRSICIFLSQYLKKNPAAFLHYFQSSNEASHVLFIWMRSFGIPDVIQVNFRKEMLGILSNTDLDDLHKNICVVNACLKTVFLKAKKASYQMSRLKRIVSNLERHLGTIDLKNLGEPMMFRHKPARKCR